MILFSGSMDVSISRYIRIRAGVVSQGAKSKGQGAK
jgi:hypothetical protein